MFQSFDQVMKHTHENEVEMVDLKFCDLWGQMAPPYRSGKPISP